MLNTLIIGNYNDLRGDSAIYLLERAPSGSCSVYFSGITGSISSTHIISHPQGDFTSSINQLNWSDTPSNLIVSAANSSIPFDLIIYHAQDYGDWSSIIDATLSASLKGIPVFTQHYNDTYQNITGSSFYGFPPSINVGWGNYISGNSGSFGNQLEFFDTINDGYALTSSTLLSGDTVGLLTTETAIYINQYDTPVNELNAVASVAAKYIKLVNALSSSYVSHGQDVSEIFTSYSSLRDRFYYDARQYLRQVSTQFNNGTGWTPSQSYGMIQLSNYSGSYSGMPDLTSSINFSNLSAGTPLYINVASSSLNNLFTFTWKNFNQSLYSNTVIKINSRTVYTGTSETYTWIPDTLLTSATVEFYTVLSNGTNSIPDSNSIIHINVNKSNVCSNFTKLDYGYSCANDGKYIAVSAVPTEKTSYLSGIVELFKYNKTTNQYDTVSYIKKSINKSQDYNVILTTEDTSLDYTGSAAGDDFIATEENSSFLISSSVVLGTEQAGSSATHEAIETEDGRELYLYTSPSTEVTGSYILEIDAVSNLVESYSDKFGTSLALYGDILVVGCPNYYITFLQSSNFAGGSVDIYDLTNIQANDSLIPIASISTDGELTFGESVSIYGNYIAVGSSNAMGGRGAVYIYSNLNGDNSTWNLTQTLLGPSLNSGFGGCLKFDQAGTFTLVVGNNNTTSTSPVYIYQYNSGSWQLGDILNSDHTIAQTLPYLDNLPPEILTSALDGFGNSVSIYNNVVIVGSPYDTTYVDFIGSTTIKHRGSVYFYTPCDSNPNQWRLVQKSWGDTETLVDNKLGFSVDIYKELAVVTNPKYYTNFTTNYINNTIYKTHSDNPNDSYYDTLGQILLFKFSPTSLQWNISFTQQKLKDYGYPYTNYGYSLSLYDETFVVGSPCFISDYINLYNNFPDPVQGYSYIYNNNDLITNYSVGNVFYRDGKVILSNSGSVFDKLMKNKLDATIPRYDLTYNSSVTLYEKQILCTVLPNEFNYSTNPTSMINNTSFTFKDLDMMMKYLQYNINGDYFWWKYLNFNVEEQSLFNLYTNNYNISQSISPYLNTLSASYLKWDVDGNSKINVNDMTMVWKYYTNTLTQDDVFKYIEPKSQRKTLSTITQYIQNNVIVKKFGQINPRFFEYEYSSSIDITGSYLNTYATTIGLYSGADLVGMAKLAHPIKIGGNSFPLNFLIKYDI